MTDRHPHFAQLVSLRPTNPWDRQKAEPEKAYKTFCLYREMGDRSLRGLAKALGKKTHRRYEQWSSTWKWIERADAYDQEMDRRYQATHAGQAEMRAKRHTRFAQLLQRLAGEELQAVLLRIEAAKAKAGKGPRDLVLKPADVLRYLHEGVELERLINGEATEIKEQASEFDYSKLSVRELSELKALRDKAKA